MIIPRFKPNMPEINQIIKLYITPISYINPDLGQILTKLDMTKIESDKSDKIPNTDVNQPKRILASRTIKFISSPETSDINEDTPESEKSLKLKHVPDLDLKVPKPKASSKPNSKSKIMLQEVVRKSPKKRSRQPERKVEDEGDKENVPPSDGQGKVVGQEAGCKLPDQNQIIEVVNYFKKLGVPIEKLLAEYANQKQSGQSEVKSSNPPIEGKVESGPNTPKPQVNMVKPAVVDTAPQPTNKFGAADEELPPDISTPSQMLHPHQMCKTHPDQALLCINKHTLKLLCDDCMEEELSTNPNAEIESINLHIRKQYNNMMEIVTKPRLGLQVKEVPPLKEIPEKYRQYQGKSQEQVESEVNQVFDDLASKIKRRVEVVLSKRKQFLQDLMVKRRERKMLNKESKLKAMELELEGKVKMIKDQVRQKCFVKLEMDHREGSLSKFKEYHEKVQKQMNDIVDMEDDDGSRSDPCLDVLERMKQTNLVQLVGHTIVQKIGLQKKKSSPGGSKVSEGQVDLPFVKTELQPELKVVKPTSQIKVVQQNIHYIDTATSQVNVINLATKKTISYPLPKPVGDTKHTYSSFITPYGELYVMCSEVEEAKSSKLYLMNNETKQPELMACPQYQHAGSQMVYFINEGGDDSKALIMCIGGSGQGGKHTMCEIYIPGDVQGSKGQWVQGPTLPEGRVNPSVVMVNNQWVYIFGGRKLGPPSAPNTPKIKDIYHSTIARIKIKDLVQSNFTPSSDTSNQPKWEEFTPTFKGSRQFQGQITFDRAGICQLNQTQLIIFGGYSHKLPKSSKDKKSGCEPHLSKTVFMFDVETNLVEQTVNHMCRRDSFTQQQSEQHGERVYAVGDGDQQVYAFDMNTIEWQAVPCSKF